jgi:hypothetical protein
MTRKPGSGPSQTRPTNEPGYGDEPHYGKKQEASS